MKEITRIHIAKVSYDIEISAKKELEKYIKKLELYAADEELLQDIEIRITELLAERSVTKDGVIAVDDVKAVREQLGEPQEFMSEEGDIAVGADNAAITSTRRIYRDIDNAVLGGVLGGIARFFNFDPLWARIAFVILLFVSFGTAGVVYVVLWAIVPPARSAAEKLQLSGKPVTLQSIRELNVIEETAIDNKTAKNIQKFLFGFLGAVSALAATGALAVTVWAAIALAVLDPVHFGETTYGLTGDDVRWTAWLMLALMVVSGLLLTALFSMLSYVFFNRSLTKRMVISAVIVIVAGITSFGAAVGMGMYHTKTMSDEIDKVMVETRRDLPAEFANVTSISTTGYSTATEEGEGELRVEYVVDETRPPYYKLYALPDVIPDVHVEADQARITLKNSRMPARKYSQATPRLVVYGPELKKIRSEQGQLQYSAAFERQQESLSIESLQITTVTVMGKYAAIRASGSGAIDMSASSVQDLSVSSDADSRVTAGVVRTLSVTHPDVCPAHSGMDAQQSRVTVSGVSSGEFRYNTKRMVAKDHETACGTVSIDDGDDYFNDEER